MSNKSHKLTKGQKKFRFRQAENQNRKCWYCFAPIWLVGRQSKQDFLKDNNYPLNVPRKSKFFTNVKATLEHLCRRTEGGDNQHCNLVVACHWCNTQRGKIPFEEWKQMMIKLVKDKKHPSHWKG